MIYVKQDAALIPDKVLKVAEKAQRELEALPADERPAFIKKKSHIWRGFSKYLSKMSYGKCWYSESDDPQSFFDVDHFRPKLETKLSEDLIDEDGYQWLAFDWGNFRLSSQRSNRLSTDEETDETVGKGSWFPLMPDSPKACWDDRCTKDESPMLLDPINKNDVGLIMVGNDGRLVPSPLCIGSDRKRVERSIVLYGLNLPKLVTARKRIIRNTNDAFETFQELLVAADNAEGQPEEIVNPILDKLPLQAQIDRLKDMTRAHSPFARTARDVIGTFPYSQLFLLPEEEAETA